MMRLLARPGAIFALLVLGTIGTAALCAPLIAAWFGQDVTDTDLLLRYGPPSSEHWLGTDEVGRDVLLRLLYGARVSMAVGLVAACLAAVIGTSIGLVAGWFGGKLDAFLMRFTDGVIALPLLPLLIVLAAIDPRKIGVPDAIAQSETFSLYRIVIIVALTGWTTVARLVRAEPVRGTVAAGRGA
jgi:peptide/nickel transport system permease protein